MQRKTATLLSLFVRTSTMTQNLHTLWPTDQSIEFYRLSEHECKTSRPVNCCLLNFRTHQTNNYEFTQLDVVFVFRGSSGQTWQRQDQIVYVIVHADVPRGDRAQNAVQDEVDRSAAH